MLIIELIYNLFALGSLSVLSGFIAKRHQDESLRGQILQGLLFGVIAFMGMMYPFVLTQGVIFDGRSVVISLCTLFFGPVSGLIVTAISGGYRLWLGGGGVIMGESVILSSFLVGLIFYYRKKSGKFGLRRRNLLLFGILVHIIMVALIFTLPGQFRSETFRLVSVTILIIYPLITVLVGMILSDQQEKILTERALKFSEKVKSASEAKYKTLFENIPIGIGIGSTDGNIIDANLAMQRIFGYSLDEFKQMRSISTYENPNDRDYLVDKLKTNGFVHQWEVNLKRKNGDIFPSLLNVDLIKHADDTLILTTVRDITSQKQAELDLKKQKNFFEQMFLQSSVSTQILDNKGYCERINHKLSEIFGVEPKDIEGKLYNIFKDQAIIQNGIDKHLERVFYEGKTAEWEVNFDIGLAAESQNIKVKDKKRVWYDNWAYPIFDENGNISHVIIQHTDITHRKNAEDALISSEKKFREILEKLQEGYYKCTLEGELLAHNPSFAQIMGFSGHDTLIGKSITEFWINQENRNSYLEKLLESGQISNYPVEALKINGEKINLIINSHLIYDQQLQLTCIEGSVLDLTERLRSEEKIRESENRYNAFVNASVDIIFIKDECLRYLLVNEAAVTFYKRPALQIIGKSDFEMMSERDAHLCHASDQKVLETNSVVVSEEFIDNQYYETTKFPILLQNDKTGIGAIIRNVTDKKWAEKIQKVQYNILDAMVISKNTEELLEIVRSGLGDLMDTSNFFVAMYDQEKDLMRKMIFKDEKDDFTEWQASTSLSGLIAKTGKSILANKEKYVEIARSLNIPLQGTHADCWLGVPIRLGNQTTGAMVVQSYSNPDAFDHRSQEVLEIIGNELSFYLEKKRISDETSKLLKAITQSPVAIVITNTDGIIEYINPKYTEITGYTYDEAFGHTPNLLKSGYHDLEFYQNMWTNIKSGKDWKSELLNKKKNGELFWVNAMISPITNSNGDITHYIGIQEDITGNKQLMAELVMAKDRAEESERLKSSFLANMSHELRTPMTGILGFSELISENVEDKEIKRLANYILESGNRLLETLNLILDLSKLEAEQTEIVYNNIDLIQLIYQVVETYSAAAGKKGLSLKVQHSENHLIINSNERMLASILHNLVNNALKYTDTGGVGVSCKTSDGKIIISVEDTGIGIAKEHQNMIFEDFRQVSEGYGRHFEGTGLGLSITRKFVQKLGGEITVKSGQGKGSCFIVTLPLTNGSEFEKVDPTAEHLLHKSEPFSGNYKIVKNILIVDDDRTNQSLLTYMLSPQYQVDTVSTGIEALSLLQKNPYDVVMLDINLGEGMTGTDVLHAIRKGSFNKNVPIIAVTAYAMKGDSQKYLDAGFDMYLSKPYKKIDLLTLLKQIY
ncbi:MAG: PAS domain S-box protein [Bacteroidales bacterium]